MKSGSEGEGFTRKATVRELNQSLVIRIDTL